jgi:hypothetical protein
LVVGQLAAGAYADGGRCVPLHRHYDEEGFFILEGRYRFQRGDQQLELGPGDFVHVPRPTPHPFEALEPSRALIRKRRSPVKILFLEKISVLSADQACRGIAQQCAVPDHSAVVLGSALAGIGTGVLQ